MWVSDILRSCSMSRRINTACVRGSMRPKLKSSYTTTSLLVLSTKDTRHSLTRPSELTATRELKALMIQPKETG